VAVLEAQDFGWGASGRNGGFCCLGGAKISDAAFDARFGKQERLAYRGAEKAAVALVEDLIARHGIDVDRHSHGETQLAHRVRDMEDLRRGAAAVEENWGVSPRILEASELAEEGLGRGLFHGALTIPLGFGLNPRKYLAGLVRAAGAAGAQLFARSPVLEWSRDAGGHRLVSSGGTVKAGQVIVATNGYSSENLPEWLAGRYMPAQSTVIVTRPLTDAELHAQHWTSPQMCYDTRNLLHYFRLMPDGRFLFEMRGGVLSGRHAEATARRRTRQHFERMFPSWAQVETAHGWSGMVALARARLPFAGRVPDSPGVWAALCYHGNGVSMGSYAGRMVADLLSGAEAERYPAIMQRPLERFPLGRLRRALMPPLYAGLWLQDRF
jgi:glycine/D-amino acid oxidase-like deaminating enzyme